LDSNNGTEASFIGPLIHDNFIRNASPSRRSTFGFLFLDLVGLAVVSKIGKSHILGLHSGSKLASQDLLNFKEKSTSFSFCWTHETLQLIPGGPPAMVS